ncbi:kinase-like protein [Rhypophila decipiens]|uniref:Kinase-like protein n=1 Tax=Rhypophila decipiens TaxID=261697 RepID=A0AAN6YE46_9PEZI|nr:kinase-like protein [Rhypophila decipiens]
MIPPASPALRTVRGFNTPATSDNEDSDYCTTPNLPGKPSTKRGRKPRIVNDVVSANCSPSLKPVMSPGMSGITKLRNMMEPLALSLDSTASSRASSMTRSDSRPPYPSPLASDTTASSTRLNSREIDPKTHKHDDSGSGSGDETASDDTTSYDVDLEHGFDANGDTVNVDGAGSGLSQPRRKMTADDFEPLRCLGKGTYGTVLLVKQRTTGRLYAQKQLKKASMTVSKKLIEQTKTERQILELVNRHPFVVKLFYAFQDHEKLYLILEYGQGGELFTHLKQERMFSEDTAAFYMAEMVLALSYLHDKLGVVYRDLKPENCLLDADGHLLLTDFGLSKVVVVDPDACKSVLGTVEYMAPEVVLGKKYGKAVDWWSLGALGFDLMVSHPPFPGNNHAKIQGDIVKKKLVFPYFVGPDAKDLLTRLLRKDPAKRLGSNMPKDLVTIKKHRFFRKIDWKLLEKRELEPPIQPMIGDPELAENFSSSFTELSLSPVVSRLQDPDSAKSAKDDPFGGFSYVASSSLLEGNGFGVGV